MRLHETDATDEAIGLLRPLVQLESVDLGFCQRLTNASVKDISNLSELELLNLEFRRRWTDAGSQA